MEMLPFAPTLVMTELATVCPAPKLRLDASGRAAPVGHTVRYDAAVGSVTVTFSATAPTPVAGTPPRPTTTMVVSTPALSFPVPAYWPSMVAEPAAEAVVVGRTTGRTIGNAMAIPAT